MRKYYRRCLSVPIALALLAAPSAVTAEDKHEDKWETRIIADRPQSLMLDPDKAYILVHVRYAAAPILMRMPSAEDAAAHQRLRSEALAKEHSSWQRKFSAWEAQMKRLASAPPTVSRRAPPVEPTEANFAYPRYEQIHSVSLGPTNRFAKENGSTYLQEVPPGEYVFYGTTGLCACLGTVAFEAPAGKVVAVEFGMPFVDALSLPKEQRPKTSLDLPAGTTGLRIGPAEIADARLPAASVIVPSFRPAGRLPNWYGIEVDRVMPIEGVFRYERDQQIDLRNAGLTSNALQADPAVPSATATY